MRIVNHLLFIFFWGELSLLNMAFIGNMAKLQRKKIHIEKTIIYPFRLYDLALRSIQELVTCRRRNMLINRADTYWSDIASDIVANKFRLAC